MVTRDTVLPVRIKFLFILDFVILSAFSLITDDGKMNVHAPTTSSFSETKEQIENIPSPNVSSLLLADNRSNALVNIEKDPEKSVKLTQLRGKGRTINGTRPKKESFLFSNATILPLPMTGVNWSISGITDQETHFRTKDQKLLKRHLPIIPPVTNIISLQSSPNVTDNYTNESESNKKPMSKEQDVSSSLKNVTEHILRNISSRHGKEFISEETLMESRNYNYEPGYPTYTQQPTASGEDPYHTQTFATITRDFWPNYPQQDLVTYPTITTIKTPRAHAYHPQYPVGPYLNRWRYPFLGYRQAARLRGTYHKDDGAPFYDYLDYGDSTPLESVNMHRWSQPGTGQDDGSSPNRPELHRYHEGGGGYEYSPHYDFAHVHEHSGHSESHDSGYKLDFSKIGLLLLIKLVIAKLKALGALQILLLLLLKAKLLLAMMALKFFMVLKALKLVKYLLAPLLLYSLLPLLPLSLLPALLPLLMNLNPPPDEEEPPDIPDVPDPDMGGDDMGGGMRRKKVHKSRELDQIQRVLRSEDCLQRFACELAAKRQMALVPLIVSWSLDKLAKVMPLPTIKAYAEAYTVGRQKDKTSSWCSTKYKCNQIKKRS